MSRVGSWFHPKDDTQRWRGRYYPYDLIKELCIAVGVFGLLAVLLTILFSSPDDKPSTIAQWSHSLPANFVTDATAELNGTSPTAEYGPPYNHGSEGQQAWIIKPQKWMGVKVPVNTEKEFVLDPLKTVPNDPALASARRLVMRIGTGPALPLGVTVTVPVLSSTLTVLGGGFFSSSAFAASSSGFAYASPQAFFCSLPAAS